jgi:hypothetical protein
LDLAGAFGLPPGFDLVAVLVLMAHILEERGNKKAALLARRCDVQTLMASVIAPARFAGYVGVGSTMPRT